MFPFRRKRASRPPGAGVTHCSGFDLVVTADIPTTMLIEVTMMRWGGTDLDPPRQLERHKLQASPQESALRISTDDGVLGHPCAEIVSFALALSDGQRAELEVTEAQGSQSSRIVSGAGWIARYPEFLGPNGLRLLYRPLHGYLD
jgi:hypothetical protein